MKKIVPPLWRYNFFDLCVICSTKKCNREFYTFKSSEEESKEDNVHIKVAKHLKIKVIRSAKKMERKFEHNRHECSYEIRCISE